MGDIMSAPSPTCSAEATYKEIISGSGLIRFTATYTYLDEPSTTGSITYKLQCRTYSGDARYFTINRTGSDSNVNYHHRGISRIMAMEVAA